MVAVDLVSLHFIDTIHLPRCLGRIRVVVRHVAIAAKWQDQSQKCFERCNGQMRLPDHE